ncbi:hypothetical protein Syun_009200 [Stephania yunnanensis]|uniref:Uncharacterized protein n=1 Tax=Stephania yunnanensis TaxID=152371 RepID=A0AAP0KDZ2_9MAGN
MEAWNYGRQWWEATVRGGGGGGRRRVARWKEATGERRRRRWLVGGGDGNWWEAAATATSGRRQRMASTGGGQLFASSSRPPLFASSYSHLSPVTAASNNRAPIVLVDASHSVASHHQWSLPTPTSPAPPTAALLTNLPIGSLESGVGEKDGEGIGRGAEVDKADVGRVDDNGKDGIELGGSVAAVAVAVYMVRPRREIVVAGDAEVRWRRILVRLRYGGGGGGGGGGGHGDGCEGSSEGAARAVDGADSAEDADGRGAAADNEGVDADEIVDEHRQLGAVAS